MGDVSKKGAANPVQIVGNDQNHIADVDLVSGKRKLHTVSQVTVESLLGADPFPDSYFEILDTGAINDTWRIQVAGITDPTASERTLPAVDFTFTVTASEADDEIALRDAIIAGLNGDTNFQNAFLKAQKAKDLAVVHVTSTLRSLSSEYYERPNAGDFDVSNPVSVGAPAFVLGFPDLKSRGKLTSLARDPDAPHRLGILGISGSVTVTPGALTDRFFIQAKNGGSPDLRVDGSVTPVDFVIPADATKSLFIEELRFISIANGIKYDQFLNNNSVLGNGIDLAVISLEQTLNFEPFKSTEDFLATFTVPAEGFRFEKQAGADVMVASFSLDNPFEIKKAGTFTSDGEVRVTINDDLTFSGLKRLELLAIGFKKEV